jgi:hypothetical protein
MFSLWKSSANNKHDVSETISNIYQETVTIVDDFIDIPVETKDTQNNKNNDIEDINISGLC